MSIGSAAEVGVEFTRWGEMSDKAREAWFNHVVSIWGTDLMGGYATVVRPNKLGDSSRNALQFPNVVL